MSPKKGRVWLASAAAAFALHLPRAAEAQEAPDVAKLAGFVRWGGLFASVFVFIGAAVALRILTNVADQLGRRFANRRPTIQKYESVARFFVYIAALGVCLSLSFRLDSTTLTVIGGTLAVAVGFAMRDLIAALIAGITIIFDRPFQVGDRVEFAGQYGDIVKIGIRSVRMNTLDHNIITIPNNRILTDVTASGNWGALEMQTPFDFYIGIDQDAELAASLIREACLTSPYVFLPNPVPLEAKQVILHDYVAMHLKARPYVFDCKYEKPFQSDVHLRVAKAFRTHGIQPPAVLLRRSADVEAHAYGGRRVREVGEPSDTP
ncbi:MAG: mechanosensitive ion channel [Myxococcales bacterium]|jgi:small-conductance mechanosensitive channel|nr:mechanosensitive ion channel [Myxococcales bacterium]MBL0198307.1 mechanosensitive ion channel [Myxococcales bacterium]